MSRSAISYSAGQSMGPDLEDELQRLHHLAELGRLSASMLHEISNPLTSALLYLEQVDDDSTPAVLQVRQSIQMLKRYVEAAQQQVRYGSQHQIFSVTTQLTQLKRIVRPIAKSASVDLHFIVQANCRVHGDPVKFQQILANLIVNAIEAYEDDLAPGLKKPVEVSLICHKSHLSISVRDWGQGIESNKIGRIFEPFFTTKNKSKHGLGIGLAIVRQYVIEEFNGSIRVRTSRRRGTEFNIRLPLVSS